MVDSKIYFPNHSIVPIQRFDVFDFPVIFKLVDSENITDDNSGNQILEEEITYNQKITNTKVRHDIKVREPNSWIFDPHNLVSFKWTKIHRMGKGLYNLANICFLNSTTQCLAYCVPLAEDCIMGAHALRCQRLSKNSICGFCLFESHIQSLLIPEKYVNSSCIWNPLFIKLMQKEIRMGQSCGSGWYGMQNCAHEWFLQFLNFLTKYDLPIKLEKDFSNGKINTVYLSTCYLYQLFSADIVDCKACLICGHESMRYELNNGIRVPINTSSCLKKAFSNLFQPEILKGSNMPVCEKCGVPRQKKCSRYIIRPPNVLVLVLQRLQYNSHKTLSNSTDHFFDSNIVKNSQKMNIPLSFDLTPYMAPEAIKQYYTTTTTNFSTENSYTFIGSVNHLGSASFGHYWAVVKGPDGLYYKVDDDRKYPINENVLSNHLSSAYLVFYLRNNPINRTMSNCKLAHNNVSEVPVPSVSTRENQLCSLELSLAIENVKSIANNTKVIDSINKNNNKHNCDIEITDRSKKNKKKNLKRINLILSSIPLISYFKNKEFFRKIFQHVQPLESTFKHFFSKTSCFTLSRKLRKIFIYSKLNSLVKTKNTLGMKIQSKSNLLCENSKREQLEHSANSHKSSSDLVTEHSNVIPTFIQEHKKQVPKKDLCKANLLIEEAGDTHSQYGVTNDIIEDWELSDTELNSIEKIKYIRESHQKMMLPKTTKRSKHDRLYDQGKVKKEKKTKKMTKYKASNFCQTADRFLIKKKDSKIY